MIWITAKTLFCLPGPDGKDCLCVIFFFRLVCLCCYVFIPWP